MCEIFNGRLIRNKVYLNTLIPKIKITNMEALKTDKLCILLPRNLAQMYITMKKKYSNITMWKIF